MSSKRETQTLGDYLAIAISPALIMALVASLVFFLVEVLYAGKYEGRLEWILFCFVAGAVLIARISMDGAIANRAGLYGLILGVAVWLALLRFVTFPPESVLAPFSWAINAALMALVWWCAHRLTWDCTYIDDSTEASGAGLLEEAGLDAEASTAKPEPPSKPERRKKSAVPQFALLAWWDGYREYRAAQDKKPHNPGVWVVYFSLAALPLFGLGQSLIPPEDGDRRRHAFWLLGVYVASGLGLLLATCYLGLRRYLRQRKLRMPVAMTGVWLMIGGALVTGLLVVAAVLPRPDPEYPLVNMASLAGSKDREASRYATKTDSPTKGDGRASSDKSGDKDQAKDGDGGQKDNRAKNQRGGKGQGHDRSGQDASGNKSGGKNNSSGKGSQDNDRQRQQGKSGSSNDDRSRDNRQSNSDQSSSSSSSPSLLKHLDPAANVLKWIVFAVIAVAVLFVILRSGLGFLANFTSWARKLLDALQSLWQALFGSRRDAEPEEDAMPAPRTRPPRPFSAYHNPFLTGAVERLGPEDLVRYSFEALEALAREHDLGRDSDETPLEFIDRVGQSLPSLAAPGRRLGELYVRLAYAHGRLPANSVNLVRDFWDHLEEAAVAAPTTPDG